VTTTKPSVPASAGPASPALELTRFLLGDRDATPSLDSLDLTGLAGHAFVRLPRHPERERLRERYVALTARHLAVKATVARLLRAWGSQGIVAMAVKGFHLAEFVYSSPGERGYNDVDLLIEEEAVESACRAAAREGLEVVWCHGEADHILALRAPDYRGHEVAQLRDAALDLKIDVHRRLVHNNHDRLRTFAVQTRLTDAARRSAVTVDWQGAA
jgi:hypothetical protein